MTRKIIALTEAEYTDIGKRHGSIDIDKEASDASVRWGRDAATLGRYGHGSARRARFEALREEHELVREKRPEAVAQKTISIKARNAAIEKGWAWVNQTTSNLGVLAREDADLATKLAAATPTEDADLAPKIITLKGLLEANAASMDPEAEVADRVSEADAVAADIRATRETATSAKGKPVEDTAELDLLDGKLYIIMKDLNTAARRAIRDGVLVRKASEYRFHHLNSGSSKKPTGDQPEAS